MEYIEQFFHSLGVHPIGFTFLVLLSAVIGLGLIYPVFVVPMRILNKFFDSRKDK